jgi:hypothetical protein
MGFDLLGQHKKRGSASWRQSEPAVAVDLFLSASLASRGGSPPGFCSACRCVSFGSIFSGRGACALRRLARQSRRLFSREEAGVGLLDGTRIDQQFAAWPSHAHYSQPRFGGEPVPGCVEHSLHELHAPENLDEELLGKDERANSIDDDRFETLWLLQHAAMRSRFSLSLKASESCASAPSDRTSAFNQTRRFSATAPPRKHTHFEKCYKKC